MRAGFVHRAAGNQQTVVRRLLGSLVAVLVALAVAAPISPVAAQDNDATAVNKKDGKSVFKLAFKVKKTMQSDVDATNTAVAFASCDSCQTVAAAIQVVLVMDDVTSVDAENVAVAINYQCSECDTLAAAYQFVFAAGDDSRFTPEGKRRLNELKQRFKALKHRDDLTLQQLADEIAVIAGEVAEVVDTELVAKETGQDKQADPTESSTTTTSSTTSTTFFSEDFPFDSTTTSTPSTSTP
jgi:putative peptide zinc metalloprotease protein